MSSSDCSAPMAQPAWWTCARCPGPCTTRSSTRHRCRNHWRLLALLCAYARTWRPAASQARLRQHGMAQPFLQGLCRLHADAGVLAEPWRVDPTGRREPDRVDVRRSGSVALSSIAHRGCLAGTGHPHRGHHDCDPKTGSHPYRLCASPRNTAYLSGRAFDRHPGRSNTQTHACATPKRAAG